MEPGTPDDTQSELEGMQAGKPGAVRKVVDTKKSALHKDCKPVRKLELAGKPEPVADIQLPAAGSEQLVEGNKLPEVNTQVDIQAEGKRDDRQAEGKRDDRQAEGKRDDRHVAVAGRPSGKQEDKRGGMRPEEGMQAGRHSTDKVADNQKFRRQLYSRQASLL